MKKYLLGLLVIIFIVPSIAFASWWNPFSWFSGWTFQKEKAPVVQQEPTRQVTDPTLKQEKDNTQKKSAKDKLPDTLSANEVKALGGVNPYTNISSTPKTKTTPPTVVNPTPVDICTNIEGIQTRIPDNMKVNIITGDCTSIVSPTNPNSLSIQQQAIIDSQNQAYQKYLSEQAEIQAKLKPLDDQFNELETEITQKCSGLTSGQTWAECQQLILKQQNITSQESAITGIYPNINSLPHSSISCSYGNGGTTWSCMDSSYHTTISCFYSDGGTVLNCN